MDDHNPHNAYTLLNQAITFRADRGLPVSAELRHGIDLMDAWRKIERYSPINYIQNGGVNVQAIQEGLSVIDLEVIIENGMITNPGRIVREIYNILSLASTHYFCGEDTHMLHRAHNGIRREMQAIASYRKKLPSAMNHTKNLCEVTLALCYDSPISIHQEVIHLFKPLTGNNQAQSKILLYLKKAAQSKGYIPAEQAV